MIAFRIEDNQIGVVQISKFYRLIRALCFDRQCAAPLEQRAQNFSRFSRFIDDQHTKRRTHAKVSEELTYNVQVANRFAIS